MAQVQMIDINILPSQYRRQAISRQQMLPALGVVVLLAVLGVLLLTLNGVQAQTIEQEDQFALLKAELAKPPTDKVDLTALQQQIDGLRAETARLRAESQSLGAGQPSRAAGLAIAIQVVVPGVTLISLTQSGSRYAVSGEAGSQAIVLDYARALQNVPAAQWRVRIVSMVNVDARGLAPDVQFVIEMAQ
jgi:Tfp pilus assembly protein PilN